MARRELSRRDLIIGGTTALALTAQWPLGLRTATASGELIATTYGGVWESAHRAAIAAPLESKLGIKVTLVSILAHELTARIKAAKGGARPPVDVALLEPGPLSQAIKEEVLEPLPEDQIPNARNIYPVFRPKHRYGVPVAVSVVGLCYDTKRVKVAPRSWADLWKPEYKGQVGLVTAASSLGTILLVAFAKTKGGSEADIEPGFSAVKSLLPNVGSVASSPANLQTLLERGEVSVVPAWHSNCLNLKAKGLGIEYAHPAEGGIAGLAYMAITKGANIGLAAQYINQALDLSAQRTLANPPYYHAPVVKGVTVVPEAAGWVPVTPEEVGKLNSVDWDTINLQRAEWINRWNREIKL